MATVAELELDAKDFALQETLIALDTVEFEVERVVAHDPEHIMPYVQRSARWVRHAERLAKQMYDGQATNLSGAVTSVGAGRRHHGKSTSVSKNTSTNTTWWVRTNSIDLASRLPTSLVVEDLREKDLLSLDTRDACRTASANPPE